jgi:protein O-GlcNAc transferase
VNEALMTAAYRMQQAGKPAEAAKLYSQVLNGNPRNSQALYHLGYLHFTAGGYETAERLFEEAAKVDPKFVDAHFARGCALQRLNRHEAAALAYDKALALTPTDVEAWSNRGLVLTELKRYPEALASFDRALAIKPTHIAAQFNRGTALTVMKRFPEAIACFERVLAADHRHVDSMFGIANVYAAARRVDDALAYYRRALAVDPNRADVLGNRAAALFDLGRFAEALADAEKLIALEPERPYARGLLLRCRLHCCDWRDLDKQRAEISAGIASGKRVIQPFALLSVSDSESEHARCAEIHARAEFPAQPAFWRGERYAHEKIRVAYLSADFSAHATAHLMAGVFEHHDKSRFETVALSFGRDDGSGMRARLIAAFDRFIDAANLTDAEAAGLLKENEIDIAVDLKGYTSEARPGILAHRAAPVQVQYLGYPGTMSAPYIHYVLADRTVIPKDNERWYTERVVCLPDSYQCNDASRARPECTLSRFDAGLPEKGFIFCCFNAVYKIMPEMFAVWMRLLQVVEGSVLWLLEDNDTASRNLRREAELRGVRGHRLRFAPKMKPEDHLARHRLADLFLDTLPYAAHTTASDALWMGLPVVACAGNAFAGRVPASLLAAAGVPELVTRTLPDYEALALKLAREPAALAALKQKLDVSRATAPLFNTVRFTQALEAAYVNMWERAATGQRPQAFAISDGQA